MPTHLLTFKETSIVLGDNLIETQFLTSSCNAQEIVIICDEHIKKLYGKKIETFLQNESKSVSLLTFPAGERSKSREVKSHLEDQLIEMGFDKQGMLLAIGGGVTTDLVGFLASTYYRGVPYISIPTSLLGMVDASIGGKTAVNTPYGKNLIGSFYLPSALIIDFNFLKSLSKKGLVEGFVEMLKIALLVDEKLFADMSLFDANSFYVDGAFKNWIVECCSHKLKIVEKDFNESMGLRKILNYGHTVAHGIEHFFEYKLGHGQAVAYGIIAESYMAMDQNLLPVKDFQKIYQVFSKLIEKKSFDINAVFQAMKKDKKNKDANPSFVQLKAIGSAEEIQDNYCLSYESEVVLNGLKFIQEMPSHL